jgi:hypothetical protein
MPDTCSETVDQPALTAAIDIDLARRAPSFEKLYRELRRLLVPPVSGTPSQRGE